MTDMPHTSATTVLVLDRFAAEYARHLLEAFPALAIHTAEKVADIAVPLDSISVLVAFGIAIDDRLMGGARNLKWIQSLATGVDHFVKSPGLRAATLLTSVCRFEIARAESTLRTSTFSLRVVVARIFSSSSAEG